jgi:hypothetical protein
VHCFGHEKVPPKPREPTLERSTYKVLHLGRLLPYLQTLD